LTSAGIKNATIERALVELLGKPIEEMHALFPGFQICHQHTLRRISLDAPHIEAG
jgi:hypothetical protein